MILHTENLTKIFRRGRREVIALNSLDLTIETGSFVVVKGPSGSGKSTLLFTLGGLLVPSSGKVFFEEKDLYEMSDRRRAALRAAKTGFVFQSYYLLPYLSVLENIMVAARLQRDRVTGKEARELAASLGMEERLSHRPPELSAGEKQRVALTRALIVKPDLLLLDEPLSALDRVTKRELQKELRTIHQQMAIPIVHVTHDFEEGLYLGNRMAVLHAGRFVQQGTPEEISSHPADPLVAEFTGIKNIFEGKIERSNGTTHFVRGAFSLEIPSGGQEKGVIAIPSEDIILSSAPLQSSARNCLACIVEDLRPLAASLMDVTLKTGGVSLVATITRATAAEMVLTPGRQCYATIKAASIRVF